MSLGTRTYHVCARTWMYPDNPSIFSRAPCHRTHLISYQLSGACEQVVLNTAGQLKQSNVTAAGLHAHTHTHITSE